MPKLIALITPQIDDSHQIGEAWKEAGAPGVTFVESHGLQRIQDISKSFEVLPGIMSVLELLRNQEQNNIIIFSIVPEATMVDRIVDVTQSILDDIDQDHKGIIFVLDVERAFGIRGM